MRFNHEEIPEVEQDPNAATDANDRWVHCNWL